MRFSRETHYGVFDRSLVETALARPKQAATYEAADLIRQAATLCYGLIRNHPWVGGNKRTATAITNEFLKRNGSIIVADTEEVLDLVFAVEGRRWNIDEEKNGLRPRVFDFPAFLKLLV
jgi:death-on-curing protein